jgi:hypothetical protein
MTRLEKKAYFTKVQPRYDKADKGTKKIILDEFCANCGYNRKYAIRLLGKFIYKRRKNIKGKSGRKFTYDSPELLEVLKYLWLKTGQLCSKRLKIALPIWLPYYPHAISEDTKILMHKISAASIDRLLKPFRVSRIKGKCGTKPGTLLKTQIPIKTHNWDVTQPGFLEADTVAHCGNSLSGEFTWTLTLTDILTGWTECRALWGKGSSGVLDAIKDVETTIPFSLKGFDCDNGSEFLNHHLVNYFAEHKNNPDFTRSRPYKKNDNAHVEQKNWTHARQLLGYKRLDDASKISIINVIYKDLWCPLQNYFCPSFKLIEKTRVGGKYIKKYEIPRTPYERILANDDVTQEIKQLHIDKLKLLNPIAITAQIDKLLKQIL